MRLLYASTIVIASLELVSAATHQHRRLHHNHNHVSRVADVTELEVVTTTQTLYLTVDSTLPAQVSLYFHAGGGGISTTLVTSQTKKKITTSVPTATSAIILSAPTATSSAILSAPTATSSIISKASTSTSTTPIAAATVAAATPAAATGAATGAASDASSLLSSADLTSLPGGKAGLSGYIGIQSVAAFAQLKPYISWYSDYSPTTPTQDHVLGVPMLWGISTSCAPIGPSRLTEFLALSTPPSLMFGFYEPDCSCTMSSDISSSLTAATAWNTYLAPLALLHGTVLGSPSMCKQYDEDWLTPFEQEGLLAPWTVTSIHVNKDSLAGAMADVEYYWNKYQRPIWVTEFACVDDGPTQFVPCTNQTEIDGFINDVVAYFEANEHVVAYGPSNGEGLGDVWPLIGSDGSLSATGLSYLNAIKGL